MGTTCVLIRWLRFSPKAPSTRVPLSYKQSSVYDFSSRAKTRGLRIAVISEGCGLSQPRFRQRRGLTFVDALHRKVLDRLVEQAIKIKLRPQMQEHRAEPDRGAIHEHKFARH